MYICEMCKSTFERPATQEDGIGYKWSACPYCGDGQISEAMLCEQCSAPKPKNREDYCDSCKQGIKKDIWDLHNKAGWDRKLLLEAMEEIMEE